MGEGCEGSLKAGWPLKLNKDPKVQRAKGTFPGLMVSAKYLPTLVKNSGAFNKGVLIEGITRASVLAMITSDTEQALLRAESDYDRAKTKLKRALSVAGVPKDEIKLRVARQLSHLRPSLFLDSNFDISYAFRSLDSLSGSVQLAHLGVNAHERRDWERFHRDTQSISRIESAKTPTTISEARARLNEDLKLIDDPYQRKDQLLSLLRATYSKYPEPLNMGTVEHLLVPNNIPLLMTGCCGKVAASLIAEHAELEFGGQIIHLYEMGSAATSEPYRASGIMTYLLLQMRANILELHPDAVIFAEARLFNPILRAVFNAGMLRAGILPSHTLISASNNHGDESPQFESLVVVYFPYKSPDVEVSTGPRIGDHASPDCNSI